MNLASENNKSHAKRNLLIHLQDKGTWRSTRYATDLFIINLLHIIVVKPEQCQLRC